MCNKENFNKAECIIAYVNSVAKNVCVYSMHRQTLSWFGLGFLGECWHRIRESSGLHLLGGFGIKYVQEDSLWGP